VDKAGLIALINERGIEDLYAESFDSETPIPTVQVVLVLRGGQQVFLQQDVRAHFEFRPFRVELDVEGNNEVVFQEPNRGMGDHG
jgi:hypothetical protein